jgi:hypothetical protein
METRNGAGGLETVNRCKNASITTGKCQVFCRFSNDLQLPVFFAGVSADLISAGNRFPVW